MIEIDLATIDLSPKRPKRHLLTPHPAISGDYILQIDNTSMEVFSTCPRAAEYRLLEGRCTPTAPPLTFGSAIHNGLESWYKTADTDLADDQRLSLALEAAVCAFDGIQLSVNEWRSPDRACDTIQRYAKRYATESFKLLDYNDHPAVEIPFSLPLCIIPYGGYAPSSAFVDPPINPVNDIHVYWTGKIDLAVSEGGTNWIIDHKTSSMVGPSFWDHFHLSNQTMGYVWAAEQLFNTRFAGLNVNCIIGRPVTKTGTHTDFERNKFYYSTEQVLEWAENTELMVGDFLANLHRNKFPMHTVWCVGKYGKCKYHDVCTLPFNTRMSMLYSDHYTDNTWSPLNE